MKDEPLPIGLRLNGKRCVVVGSGREAEQRAGSLMAAGALVSVITEKPSPTLRKHAACGELRLFERQFVESDVDEAWLAVLTDRDEGIAKRLDDAARRRRVLFCAVDQPDYGSFSHLAIARAGSLFIAVGTNGKAPALARRLREELSRLLDESGAGAYLNRLYALRSRTPPDRRRAVQSRAVAGVRFEGRLVLPEPGGDEEGA